MKWFRSLSFSKQIVGYYLILFIITVSVCMSLYFYIMESAVSGMENATLELTLRDVKTNSDSLITRANEYSKIITFSEDVQNVLRNAGSYNQDSYYIDTSLVRLVTGSTYVASVYVFDNYGNTYHAANEYLRTPASKDVKQASWYQEALAARGGYVLKRNAGNFLQGQEMESNYISLIRVINDLNTMQPIGVIVLNISDTEINKIYHFAQTEYGLRIMLLDEEQIPIINTINFDQEQSAIIDTTDADQEPISVADAVDHAQNNDYKSSSIKIENSNWEIIGFLPRDMVGAQVKSFTVITIMILALNGMLLCVGAVIITRFISEPVHRLLASMKKVEQKEFAAIQEIPANLEINQLQSGYNRMITELNDLFDEVVAGQRMKRKYELEVLHAQIKPHFLYNTFDSIGALALMGRLDDVFTMIQALGSYYRLSLHKGQEVITIGEELKIVYNYLIIQKYRYEDVFEASYDIDENVKQYKTLKLVLQPFVENAIYHGLKTKEKGGNLIVRAKDQGAYVILEVEDDGSGMTPRRLNEVVQGAETEDGKSFGVFGTIERIHLYYEREDLVEIKSRAGIGTTISVRIPKDFRYQ